MAPRTALLHPRTYFEERGFDLVPAAAAVGVAILTIGVALIGFGVLLSNRLEDAGHPEATSAVWQAIGSQLLGTVLVGFLFGWLLTAVFLHFLSRAAVSHEGTFGQTLAVTGWGIAPTALSTLVTFGFLALALQDASMATPETFVEEFRAHLGASGFVQNVLTFIVATWQTYIYGNGLVVAFDDAGGNAWLVAGFVAYGSWVLSLF